MLRAQYSNLQVNDSIQLQTLYDNLESIKVLLKNDPLISQKEGYQSIELFESALSTVHLEAVNWGVFAIVGIKTSWRHLMREQYLLLGDNIWEKNRPSLFLADKNRYLSVCGETWLGGPVDLPALGVRKSYVDGVGYYRAQAVQGDIRRSESNVPGLDSKFKGIFESLFAVNYQRDSVVSWDEVFRDSISQSFKKKTLCLWSPEVLSIENIKIKGKVKVVSQKEIRVGNNVKLDQCLLVAPKIQFAEGFKGRAQLFAKDSVLIGSDSHFLFPSVIYMDGGNGNKELNILNSVRFTGDIVITGKMGDKEPVLKIGKESEIEGFAYCDGTVELEGDVAGSLYTNRFILKTPSALYENHLLNNRIDFSDLKKSFVGVSWFGQADKRQLIECLY
nr:hypothetical protein [uncultured Marinifilum sp.]